MNRFKKIVQFVALLAVAASLLVPVSFAESVSVWDGTTRNDSWYGDGTATEFTLNSAADLAGLAQLVNSGVDFAGKTVKLAVDIDLAGKQWTPIGGYPNQKSFKGLFDGCGKTISNLSVGDVSLTESEAAENFGLFGSLASGGELKNFTIENAAVYGGKRVGAVLGSASNGSKSLSNITVKGNVVVNACRYAGGIVGYAGYLNLIDECHVTGSDGSSVKALGGDSAGGITAYLAESGGRTISGCSVSGLTISAANRVGGIAGLIQYPGTAYVATVTGCSVTDCVIEVTDDTYGNIGLIVGSNQGRINNGDIQRTMVINNTVTNVTATYKGEPVKRMSGPKDKSTDAPVTISGTGIQFNAADEVVAGTFDFDPGTLVTFASGVEYATLADGRVLVHDHAIGSTPVPAKPASCTEPGNIEYYSCPTCAAEGTYFDAAGNALSYEDIMVAATGHDWGEWTTVAAATCTSYEQQRRVCANDDSHVETRSTDHMAPHTDYNGDCLCDSGCGAKFPGYVGRANPSTGVNFKLPCR